MKNNYPIRYAVVPMKDIDPATGNSTVYGYMITKCYVVGENNEYSRDGRVSSEYIVSCPYITTDNSTWKRTEIDKDHFVCVKNVYNSFYEAVKERVQLNDKLLDDYLSHKHRKEFGDQIRMEFFDRMNFIKELELKIESGTRDINPYDYKKEQTFIETNFSDYKSNKVYYSIYNLIDSNMYGDIDYNVYTVSRDEYTQIQYEISKGGLNVSRHCHSLLLLHNANNDVMELFSPQKRVSYIKNGKRIDFDVNETFEYSNPRKFIKIIFTQEEYDDIIKSYDYDRNDIVLSKKFKPKMELKAA